MRYFAGLAVAACTIAVSCTSPGSVQVAQAWQCMTRTATVPASPLPMQPAWRTFSVPGAGIRMALPVNWDGLAVGTSNEDARLSEIDRRSPALSDLLDAPGERSRGEDFFAISTDGGRLDVMNPAGITLGGGLAAGCSTAPAVALLDQLFRTREGYRLRETRLPAGVATVATFVHRSVVRGKERQYGHVTFALEAVGGRNVLLMFSAPVDRMATAAPEFWTAMRTLRRIPVGPASDAPVRQPACLYANQDLRDLTAARPPVCAIPVGAVQGEMSCGSSPVVPSREMTPETYDEDGEPAGNATPGVEEGQCLFLVAAGNQVAMSTTGTMTDAIYVLDYGFGFGGDPTVSIVTRLRNGQSLGVDVSATGDLAIYDNFADGTYHRLTTGSSTERPPVHRLIMSVSGTQVRVWLDGQATTGVRTTVTQTGYAEAYLSADESSPHEFHVVRAEAYAAAAS